MLDSLMFFASGQSQSRSAHLPGLLNAVEFARDLDHRLGRPGAVWYPVRGFCLGYRRVSTRFQ
jgi:hypothetical protein